jgi:hypothetical protein
MQACFGLPPATVASKAKLSSVNAGGVHLHVVVAVKDHVKVNVMSRSTSTSALRPSAEQAARTALPIGARSDSDELCGRGCRW